MFELAWPQVIQCPFKYTKAVKLTFVKLGQKIIPTVVCGTVAERGVFIIENLEGSKRRRVY